MSDDGAERERDVEVKPSLPESSPFGDDGVAKDSQDLGEPNTEGPSTGDGDQPSAGKPPQLGPQYKRGRGRTFFKELPRRGLACQGWFRRVNNNIIGGDVVLITGKSQNTLTFCRLDAILLYFTQFLDVKDPYLNFETITR